jgi:acetylornithine/succinyldiaminopimelate/putrescine aminotransferase
VKTISTEEQLLLFRSQMMKKRKSFGPFTAGFIKIPYDDADALEQH